MWKHSLSYLYFTIFFKFTHCCQCNLNTTDSHPNHNSTGNDISSFLEKRQLEFEDYSMPPEYDSDYNFTESATDVTITHTDKTQDANEATTESTVLLIKKKLGSYAKKFEVLDNSSEVNQTMEGYEITVDLNDVSSTPKDITSTSTEMIERRKTKVAKYARKDLLKKCRHFKKGNKVDFKTMADVWQVVFYRLPSKLKCFKLHIKSLSRMDQLKLAKNYGNFNETVHWHKCHMEIISSDKSEISRRHFLQGSQIEKGVMENIIIDEEHCQNTTFLTLYHESADQWLVHKNILLMRDCDSGDLVVFTRVPLEPRKEDILEALKMFGETKANGTMACEEQTDKTWLKYDDSDTTQS